MRIKMILLTLLSILISVLSWFMNFGFIRLFCSMLLVPFAYTIILLAISVVAAKYSANRKIRAYNSLFCLTYIFCNIFFPDADEVSTRMFFGLIENEFICKLGGIVSIIALIMHIVFLALLLIEINRTDSL